jgi:hypothetical protein
VKPSYSCTWTLPHQTALFDLAVFTRMCLPIEDGLRASRLGFEDLDCPTRLLAHGRHLRTRTRESPHPGRASRRANGEQRTFVERRVDAGDPNFIRILDEIGGMERYEHRLRWWQASQEAFVRALG